MVFISQSGASAEVAPVIESLPRETVLLAVTNDAQSQLAQWARVVFPLLDSRQSVEATLSDEEHARLLELTPPPPCSSQNNSLIWIPNRLSSLLAAYIAVTLPDAAEKAIDLVVIIY